MIANVICFFFFFLKLSFWHLTIVIVHKRYVCGMTNLKLTPETLAAVCDYTRFQNAGFAAPISVSEGKLTVVVEKDEIEDEEEG